MRGMRRYKGNLHKDAPLLVDVDTARTEMVKGIDALRGRLAEAVSVSKDWAAILREGSAQERTTFNTGEFLETVRRTAQEYIEDFGDAHSSIYGRMGRITLQDGDSNSAWRILNGTMMGLYSRESGIINETLRVVNKARSVEEISDAWDKMVKESDGTVERLHILSVIMNTSTRSELERFGKSSELDRAIEMQYSPSFVTLERWRTQDILDESAQTARMAARIENPGSESEVYSRIARHYHAAAELAAKASRSYMHSKPRRAAREKVLQLYVQAVENFISAGEKDRAMLTFGSAVEISETTLHNKRAPKELAALGRKLGIELR